MARGVRSVLVTLGLRDPAARRLLLAGFTAFFVIGALQALYGPALPFLAVRLDVGLDVLGQTVALHFAGSFVTIALAGPLLARTGYRWPLAAGAAVLAAGAATVAFASGVPTLLVGALLGGLGFGLVDVAMNLWVARAFAPNAAPALNLLNATFGLGSVAGPAVLAAVGGDLRTPMLAVAVIGGVLLVLVPGLREPERGATGPRGAVPWVAAAGFLALYVLYVTSEAGVGAWEATHLAPLVGERTAALHVSLYWGALTVGRLLATPLSARVRPGTLVTGASALAAVALAAAHVAPLAPYAYAVAGLAFAPIFPTGLAWLQTTFEERSEAVASAALAAATLGPAVTSGAIGWSVERFGPGVVPTLLASVAALLLATAATLRLRVGRG